jgi:hypothetical protein
MSPRGRPVACSLLGSSGALNVGVQGAQDGDAAARE